MLYIKGKVLAKLTFIMLLMSHILSLMDLTVIYFFVCFLYFPSSAFVLDPAEEYRMNHKRRGLALIFNQEIFYWHLRLNTRSGTNTDKLNLIKRFEDLGFEVKAYDDSRRADVIQIITEAADANHADADCFVCIFLSHGQNGHIYTYDDKIEIQDITALFKGDKCQSLVGKPKIFILQVTHLPAESSSVVSLIVKIKNISGGKWQACRGDKHDDPVTPMDAVDSKIANETVVDAGVMYTLPAGADFLMCYSVAEGFYSHRETVNGSWYIQDLCQLLRQYGSTLEFTELLTLINRKVSQRSVGMSSDPAAIGKKQVPCFASMLTKKLYFRPKKGV
uniref:Caspase-6 n=1 Tax=Electrophorus electricus TaxID=8005 RepID=A0AAY5F123_ELEEL